MVTATSATTASRPAGVESGDPSIAFAAHIVRAGGEMGARDDFETMIGQLVTAVYPGARMISANPGDWGIDAFVGDLGGEIVVWQSKFFYPLVSKKHQQEIRDSFKQVCRQAELRGYTLKQWVLCVPSDMDAPSAQWWDGWKRRNGKGGLTIDLWDANRLRSLLITPDAVNVRKHFYGPIAPTPLKTREVVRPDPQLVEDMESALFVSQLRAAGHVEVGSAKRQFFNADLMAREIADKAVPAELVALSEADAHVHMLWEDRFNDACNQSNDDLLPGLHGSVMDDIQSAHSIIAVSIKASQIHTRGLMHRVVDDRRAGWIKNWRTLAAGYPEQPVDSAVDSPSPRTSSNTADQAGDVTDDKKGSA